VAEQVQIPGIPSSDGVADPAVVEILDRMREAITLLGGITTRQPMANGQLVAGSGWGSGMPDFLTPDGYDPTTDYTVPPRPENVVVSGGFAVIILDWTVPTFRNFARAEVWKSAVDNLSSAVMAGSSVGAVFTDYVGNNAKYYYWVRFVSQANVVGPWHASAGSPGQSALDPAYVLQVLTGQITESHLYNHLNERINLVDGPETLAGSVAQRYGVLQQQIDDINQTPPYDPTVTYISGDLVTYDGGIYSANQTTTGNPPTDSAFWTFIGNYASVADAVAQHTIQIQTNANDIVAEATKREALGVQITGGSDTDDISQLSAGLIYQESLVRATTDASLTQQITTVASQSGDNSAALQQEITTRTSITDGLLAQWTVKTDVNGYVAGFGLASSANNSTPTSDFAVRADRFYIANPTGPGIVPAMPFVVQTTPTVINGVNVPVGVYIDRAMIANGTIGTAQIGVGVIDTAKIADAAITTAKIGFAQVGTAQIIDASISTAKIQQLAVQSAQIADAAITNAKIATLAVSTANIQDGAITTAKIGNAQIDTAQIKTGAIDTAAIQNGAITNALIANLAVATANIQDGAIANAKIANGAITNAKIENAAITTAKIGVAEVDTLRIAGNAVTVMGTLGGRSNQTIYLNVAQAGQLAITMWIDGFYDFNFSFDPTVRLYVDGTLRLALLGEQYVNGTSSAGDSGDYVSYARAAETRILMVPLGPGTHSITINTAYYPYFGGAWREYAAIGLLAMR
jgi:hypothetical protein